MGGLCLIECLSFTVVGESHSTFARPVVLLLHDWDKVEGFLPDPQLYSALCFFFRLFRDDAIVTADDSLLFDLAEEWSFLDFLFLVKVTSAGCRVPYMFL